MADRTVRFAINVWAGWSPIIYANNGFKPGKVWKTPGGKDFKVELVLIDDPVAMRDAYAAGNLHIGWATLDMLPLFLEGLRKDSRVMPRVYQQVDWSNGGDGIVVRDTIKTMADLRGKTVVLAQNSPSHFFVLNALINARRAAGRSRSSSSRRTPSRRPPRSTPTRASPAWSAGRPTSTTSRRSRATGCWSTTSTANKLIADVWFARADFAKDNPDIIEGLVARHLRRDGGPQGAGQRSRRSPKLMAAGYSIPESDALGMLGDAHSTNYAENREFFLNQNNPTNFERTWTTAYFLYKKINAVTEQTPFDQVMDFSVIQKLGSEPKYASQKNEYDVQFAPATRRLGAGREGRDPDQDGRHPLLPELVGPEQEGHAQRGTARTVEELYDPNVGFVVEEIGKLAGQYGAARIVIEGHTDASMKASGAEEPGAGAVAEPRQLGEGSAGAEVPVAAAEPVLDRRAWAGTARPIRPIPENHAKNRRVEIKVYPAEAAPAAK